MPWRAVMTAIAVAVVSQIAAPTHAQAAAPSAAGPVDTLPQVVRGAHRGGALEGPEGTFAGMDAALRAGSDVLDLDVRSLADGELAVSHDYWATRLSTSRARVRALSTAQWLGLPLDVANWFAPGVSASTVTLPQVLERYAGRAVLLVELKTAASLERAVAEVRAAGAEDSVILQSIDPAVVRRIRDAGLHADVWRTPGQLAADDPATWTASGAEQLIVRSITPPAELDKAIASGLPVWVCGVNRPAQAAELVRRGASGILSDAPAYTYGRTTARRRLPVAHWLSSLRLRRGTTGYVQGRVLLPALGAAVPGVRVTVRVGGTAHRGRSDSTGRFRVAVTAPARVGTYRVHVSSTDLTVSTAGSELLGWPVRWDRADRRRTPGALRRPLTGDTRSVSLARSTESARGRHTV